MIKNTSVTIKQTELHEIKEINNLLYLSKGYWGYDRFFMDKFMEEFSITADYVRAKQIFSCYYNLSLAGFFAFTNTNELELDYFFISSQCIGKGIGKELWHYCTYIAQSKYNKKHFIIYSDPNAESFYLRMGCKRIGTKESSLIPNREIPILEYWII